MFCCTEVLPKSKVVFGVHYTCKFPGDLYYLLLLLLLLATVTYNQVHSYRVNLLQQIFKQL